MSTRIIGAIIMTHGDDNGLVLPPAVAPVQVMVVPVAMHKPGVLEQAETLTAALSRFCRAKIDATDNTPGWKFAEHEMRGVPLRLELGPKDIEQAQCVLVRRDTGEKQFVPLAELETAVPELLQSIHDGLYQRALDNRTRRTFSAATLDELTALAAAQNGFIKAMWCGDRACEETLKEQAGVTSRCIPFAQEQIGDGCVVCGKPAHKMVYWGKAY